MHLDVLVFCEKPFSEALSDGVSFLVLDGFVIFLHLKLKEIIIL